MGGFDRAGIIAQHAGNGLEPRLDEDSESQIIWALWEPSGHGASCFSKLEPAPHIGWLEIISREGLLDGTVPRPRSYWDPTVHAALNSSTSALVDWLCRHLDKPELINWVIKNGCNLHPEFSAKVQRKLLDAESITLPKGSEKFWRFILLNNALIYNPHFHYDYYNQRSDFEKRSWDALTKDLVISWLAPNIEFSEHMRWRGDEEVDPHTLNTFASMQLVPALGNSSHEFASKLMGLPHGDEIAQDLLGPLSDLIHKGLSYLDFLGSPLYSTIGRHSIDNGSGNWQTQHWTAYVVLLRDCWTRVAIVDPERAHSEVTRWSRWSFSFFRRFVLWSSGKPGGLSATESVEYLRKQLEADPEWYYDIGAELTQYLRTIASSLSPEDAESLVELMLASHANQYPNESDETFSKRIQGDQYSRLNALQKGGLGLPVSAKIRLDAILRRHPEWNQSTVPELDEGDVAEGAMWGDPSDNDPAVNVYLGWDDNKVSAEIMAESGTTQIRQRWRCLQSKDPNRAIRILKGLGKAEYFQPTIWSDALENLRQGSISSEGANLYADFFDLLGDQFLSDNLAQLASLLSLDCEEKHQDRDSDFWKLWDAIYELAIAAIVEDLIDPVDTAYNSPIGKLTRALVLKIGEGKPQKWDEVNKADQDRLVKLLGGTSNGHRLSRMILAIYTRWLHWLLPANESGPFLASFDQDVSDEAKNLWLGYLMSQNISPDLWFILQGSFEKMLSHSTELGEREDQLFSFFAHILLGPEFQINPLKARGLLKSGSAKCRSQVASYWRQQITSATDYGEKTYNERLKYLLNSVWPLELDLRDEESAESLAGIAVECGSAFPDAVNTVRPFLVKLKDSATLLYSLNSKNLADKYPYDVLKLANPESKNTQEYIRLEKLLH